MNKKKKYSYQELKEMFGGDYSMPSEAVKIGDEIIYRCPYAVKCPIKKNCFAATAAKPLQEDDVLCIKCSLLGSEKIPIYARAARSEK